MDHPAPAPAFEPEIDLLLRASHGKPVIQIVLDAEHDSTTIRGVGIDQAAIPRFILDLGRVLTGQG